MRAIGTSAQKLSVRQDDPPATATKPKCPAQAGGIASCGSVGLPIIAGG